MSSHQTAWPLTVVLSLALAASANFCVANAQDSYSGSQYDVYREVPDPDAGASDSRYGTPTRPPTNYDTYSGSSGYSGGSGYSGDGGGYRANDAYQPPPSGGRDGYGSGSAYNSGPPDGGFQDYRESRYDSGPGRYADEPYDDRAAPPLPEESADAGTYSQSEILAAGHKFFGSVSKGLASVVEYAFQQAGRPNGYILGEDAGGAFVAGLRYGEGRLYTRFAGTHKVYWQGPSIGYDFGGEGSKTMVLVYNLRDPSEIYQRFPGVQGSAYVVGGVSIQFQKYGNVTLAPIRSGVGLRLGANIGYLKYTRSPTWNPF